MMDFKKLRVLRIAANHFKKFPDQIMDILNLGVLDISKNEIEKIPDTVFKMEKWVPTLITKLKSMLDFVRTPTKRRATIFTFFRINDFNTP